MKLEKSSIPLVVALLLLVTPLAADAKLNGVSTLPYLGANPP